MHASLIALTSCILPLAAFAQSCNTADRTIDLILDAGPTPGGLESTGVSAKTRLMKKHRPRKDIVHHLEERVLQTEPVDLDGDGNGVHPVVKTERYAVKPMFIDEAVLQLEMSARQFLVFLNARNTRVSVLYRRKAGDFGLIEPATS
jgi:hypothetical protein